jgi:predicted Zn-dependent protease with MMP-like domain
VDLRHHWHRGHRGIGSADLLDGSVTERDLRLRRYRAARQRVLPRVSRRAFEELVAQALDQLPPYVQERMENVAVLVQEWPSARQLSHGGQHLDTELLGLYEGINRVDRSSGYHLVTPDRITLFRRPILDEVGDGDEAAIRAEIRKTVIHEVAHHFGIDDAELERLGG